ncbi:BREX system Lon protease-like protein BrxL [Hymenobacter taeanensis]|uniref:BREX system Lon protease-like protein BrxL n=1 Tax=Hymenobacter taeanensis TaxID=2735321 RepID=A0A6M6BJ33_9BACT|nr:BREX system Lon protease-like protein BrxL [Hymenobacter taeanensis]QJX47824.1 BREX system Lon protease-like protein BrxL [Hymenobacter taeanensis]
MNTNPDDLFSLFEPAAPTLTPLVNGVDLAALEAKVERVFGSVSIDKRRLPASKLQSRGIPGYVAEWVLESKVPGRGPLSAEDAAKVLDWAARVVPKPDEGNLIRNRLLNGEAVRILTPVQVDVVLSGKKAERVAKLPMIGEERAQIAEHLLEAHPALLQQGMWGVAQLLYIRDQGIVITEFQPMQATVSLDRWREARHEFRLEEWRALLLLTMGYNPAAYSPEAQLLVLARLLPLVQKNVHLMELAPKGTGKSYIYENISPLVRLISGGNVSPSVLFVNNQTNQPGILARYAVVVLDEVQTLKFDNPAEIVGGLKGYLANGKISRGGKHEMASDCGFVLLANITLDANQRPANEPIVVRELPVFLQETAFLDRIKGMIPGWEVPKLSPASFAEQSGLKADYFSDILLHLRQELTTDAYCARHINLGPDAYQRNQESVRALASGYMKLLFPHGEVSPADFQKYCVEPAIKLRQGVWDQLFNLDAEYRKYGRYITVERS